MGECATKKCTKPWCKKTLPLTAIFNLCSSCRERDRINKQKGRVEAKKKPLNARCRQAKSVVTKGKQESVEKKQAGRKRGLDSGVEDSGRPTRCQTTHYEGSRASSLPQNNDEENGFFDDKPDESYYLYLSCAHVPPQAAAATRVLPPCTLPEPTSPVRTPPNAPCTPCAYPRLHPTPTHTPHAFPTCLRTQPQHPASRVPQPVKPAPSVHTNAPAQPRRVPLARVHLHAGAPHPAPPTRLHCTRSSPPLCVPPACALTRTRPPHPHEPRTTLHSVTHPPLSPLPASRSPSTSRVSRTTPGADSPRALATHTAPDPPIAPAPASCTRPTYPVPPYRTLPHLEPRYGFHVSLNNFKMSLIKNDLKHLF
ncbi:hypothetical protein BU17DRAFT_85544 [Hysterangium stoloniferum]|nr:hypothetical protein BU17DRAFT_85544 [Hysterangium stoloniferum]